MNFDRIRELLWEQTFHSSKLSSVLVMLEEVGKFISGRTPKSDELASIGDIPYFKVGDMNTEGNEKFLRITSLFLKEKAGKTFPAGAIVYPKNGGAVFTNKRRILATESVIDLNTGGFVCGEKLNQAYAYMFFCGLDFRKISKGTALPTIDQKKLHRTKIPVPSLEEQSSIVTRLEEAFAEIDRAEKAYEELQMLAGVLKGQILQEAVQGKLVPQLAEEGVVEQIGEGTSRIPFTIPEKWKWVQLKSVGQIVGGGTPKTSVADYWGDEISWVTPADLGKNSSKWIHSGAKSITRKGLDESSAKLMPEGSVVYSSRAPIGHIAIAGQELCTNQGCKSFVPNTDLITTEWAYYTLIARTKDIQSRASGTTFKEISGKGMGETWIALPPLGEQQRIVTKIEDLLNHVDALTA